MTETMELKPCPWCNANPLYVTSMARSFDPPRPFLEIQHPENNCAYFVNRGPLFSCTDKHEGLAEWVTRWNTRTLLTAAAQPATDTTGEGVSISLRIMEAVICSELSASPDRRISDTGNLCLKHLDTLKAALLSKPAAVQDGWQPIETAPKDGTHILVSNGYWIGVATFDEPNYEDDPCWLNPEASELIEPVPTHWMPIPSAPPPNDERGG